MTFQAGYTGLSKAGKLVSFQSVGVEPQGSTVGKKQKLQRSPMALVVEPARELAQQTHDSITRFRTHLSNPPVR